MIYFLLYRSRQESNFVFHRALFGHFACAHLRGNGIKMLLRTSRFHFRYFRNCVHFANFCYMSELGPKFSSEINFRPFIRYFRPVFNHYNHFKRPRLKKAFTIFSRIPFYFLSNFSMQLKFGFELISDENLGAKLNQITKNQRNARNSDNARNGI